MSRASDRLAEAAAVRPSARQLAWQLREFYGFLHFSMNTMTDREWGLGREDPALFDPAEVDAREWVRDLAAAGMTGVILTCKHHDGFALWPSAQSAHTVAASPWRGGEGDLVREVADACRAEGLGFGVYLSPWDRTEASYGAGRAYDDFFVAQLTELLTGYGPVFAVWLDGANGEGADGRRQYYDWDRYYEVIRRLQPDAVISVCGPDVRWCGNEAGHTRAEEWSVVPASLREAELTAWRSQRVDDGQFSRSVRSDDDDLGGRSAILGSDEPLAWYPAEVNTSTRPGWFHHAAEDALVRSAAELFEIYRRSVGGNATFLLNVPPAASGRIAEADRRMLAELGARIRSLDETDLALAATVTYSSSPLAAAPGAGGVWRPEQADPAPTVRLRFAADAALAGVGLREDIAEGQQIDGFVARLRDAQGSLLAEHAGASVGAQRIVDTPAQGVREVQIEITGSRGPVALSQVRVFAGTGTW